MTTAVRERTRHGRAGALLVVVSGVLLLAATIVLTATEGLQGPVRTRGFTIQAVATAYVLVAAITLARRANNRISWLFAVIGLGLLTWDLGDRYAIFSVTGSSSLPGAELAAWLASWIWVPTFGCLALVLPLWFPTGSVPSRRWKPLERGIFALLAVVSLLAAFSQDPASTTVYPNPVAIPAVSTVNKLVFLVLSPLFPLIAVLCGTSLVIRFRNSRGAERQQLKWFVLAVALFASYMLVSTLLSLLSLLEVDQVPTVVEVAAFAGVPVAAGVAILRYRLYEIDLVINRTLVYGSLTAILAAAYVGLVFSLQALLAPITAESDLAIAASTLAVAALFRPLRSRVQGFIDRRFYRRKFDAQRTLEEFSAHLRDEVDLGALSERLTAVVADTMQPAHLSLWLRTEVSR